MRAVNKIFHWLGSITLLLSVAIVNAQTLNEALISAAEQGATDKVLKLLEAGADIDARDERGRTAIMAATHGNHPSVVNALIQTGANVNIQNHIRDNPFLYAGAEGLLDILKLLIDADADTTLTNRFGGTALIPAAERGHVEVVRELLTRSNVDVNHINNLGWTALMEAIVLSNGGPSHQEIVKLLIEHGADVNIPDHDGVSPLQHAKRRGFDEIVRLLEQAGGR